MNVRALLLITVAMCLVLASCGDRLTNPLAQSGAGGDVSTAAAFSEGPIDDDSMVASGATVTTDKDDYQPGDTVSITGAGWEPGETVHIHISEEPENHPDHNFYVEADDDGAFTHRDLVMDEDHLGVTFSLTATGESSGKVAEAVFTDGFPGPNHLTIEVAQDPNPVEPGSAATYTVALQFNGKGGQCTVDLTFTASASPAWPSGYSASFSNPSLEEGDVESSEVTIEVPSDASADTYGFTIGISYPSDHDCQSSTNLPTAPGTLVVAGSTDEPTTTTVADATATYGDPTVTLSATVSGGDVDAGEVTFTVTDGTTTIGTATSGNVDEGEASVEYALPAGTDAGTYSIDAAYGGALGFESSDADPGTLTIDQLEITGSFMAEDREYDGTTDATVLSRTVGGAVVDDDVTLSGGTATFGDKNVGENKTVTLTGASLSGSDAGNYNLTSVATTTADITPRGITGIFTAEDKEYDGNTSATILNRSLDGVLGNDDVTLTGGTATFEDKNVGTGKTVTLSGATLSGADADNYELDADPTTTADITAKDITGTFTADDKVYDGTTAATVASRSLDGVIGADDVTLSGGTAAFADKNVGDDKAVTLSGATLSGTDGNNYNLTSVATTTADITPAPLTATADDVSRNFSDASAVILTSVSYAGFVPGEGASIVIGGPQLSTTYVLGDDAGTYPITWADPPGISAPNYDITFVGGTLTIVDDVAPAVLDITLDPTFLMTDEGSTSLRARIDDSSAGNSDIASAEYSVLGMTDWLLMTPEDGSFDSPVEWVTATIGPISGPTVLDVCVRGTDSADNTSDDTTCGFLAVVDPSEGFVTGGGWIDSPYGSYAEDPDLVGKANFGFVSRYRRGAQTPDGNTQFQFKAADLNFHSTDYEWLVVSGGSGRAQFKGEGRLNGVAGYSFTLTVIDAEMSDSNDGDRFRIKITNGSGSPVYDNEMGKDDSGDPTTTIGGGSIVIHTGGNGNGNGNR